MFDKCEQCPSLLTESEREHLVRFWKWQDGKLLMSAYDQGRACHYERHMRHRCDNCASKQED